ncbi:MAG: right-handed parallel beta-helix repeat-containing protein [Calditrichaeota bacterium]|nr:right-handed parallel beta-helix repeat-containing protein [Calditrichota bacterium]
MFRFIRVLIGNKLTLCLLILIHAVRVFPDTNVSGEVSGVWDVDGSPYIATDSIFVPVDEELTIEPGVEVRFEEHIPFLVYGLLRAVGTEEDSVLFRSNGDDDDLRWCGIYFLEANDESILEYAHIEDGGYRENSSWKGGGIHVDGCSATIRNCLITGSQGTRGSIITRNYADVLIENNLIEGNLGGGIYCRDRSSAIIQNNIIRRNIAYSGAGIWVNKGGLVVIKDNLIQENETGAQNMSAGRGGGISISETEFVVVEGNEILNNISRSSAGGVEISSSKVVFKNNIVMGNNSRTNGGGLTISGRYNYSENPSVIVVGNIITENHSDQDGGGIYVNGRSDIYNNVIYGNSAERGGGVINTSNNENNKIMITNCIIWANEASEGAQIDEFHGRLGYSIVEGGFEGEEIIEDDPQFTDPDAGDFRLEDDSPGIDAGHPFVMYNDTDQSRNDIGAYGGNPLLFVYRPDIVFPPTGTACRSHDQFVICNTGEEEIALSRWQLDDEDNFSVDFETPVELIRYT